MAGINKVLIMGRLGHPPSMKEGGGTAICNLSIATSEAWKDKQTGEKKEKTEWHKCVAFGKTAEIIGEHFSKGGLIFVEGKIQTRSWDKDGETKYATEIIISSFQFCGDNGKPKDESGYEEQKHQKDTEDDDCPF